MKKEDWEKSFNKYCIISLNKNNLSSLMQGVEWILVTNEPFEIICTNVDKLLGNPNLYYKNCEIGEEYFD